MPARNRSSAIKDPSRGATIDEMPLNAANCEPAAGADLKAGEIEVRGYAIDHRSRVRIKVA